MLKEDSKGGDTVGSFRQNIRDQLRKGNVSPSYNTKRILSNKLKNRANANEIAMATPSFHNILQENMHKLSTSTPKLNRRLATQKPTRTKYANPTHEKFNFEASQFNSAYQKLHRPQSIDPNSSARKNYLGDTQQPKSKRKVSHDSRKSSNSVQRNQQSSGVVKVQSKAKMLKIQRLKELYVEKC